LSVHCGLWADRKSIQLRVGGGAGSASHTAADTTEIYAQRDEAKAMEVIRQVG